MSHIADLLARRGKQLLEVALANPEQFKEEPKPFHFEQRRLLHITWKGEKADLDISERDYQRACALLKTELAIRAGGEKKALGIHEATSKLQLAMVPGVSRVTVADNGHFLTHIDPATCVWASLQALKHQIEQLGFEGVGEGDDYIAWRRLPQPDKELCAVFTASQWKQFGAAGCHPFTDEQIDAAAKTREGILGEWGGATCLVSKKLDE